MEYENRKTAKQKVARVVGCRWGFVVVCCAAGVWATLDSLRGYLLRYSGYAISITPPLQEVSIGPGEVAAVRVTARNLLERNITVSGMATDCGCLSSASFPLVIPAGGEAPLDFSLAGGKVNATLGVKRAKLFLDASSLPVIAEFRVHRPSTSTRSGESHVAPASLP